MIAYTVMKDSHSCRKILGTYVAVRVEKEKGIVYSYQTSSGHSPVYDLVMYIQRSHIVYVLRIVRTGNRFSHTDELTRLGYNSPDISAVSYAAEFALSGGSSVHDYRSYCRHALLTFASCLALYETGEKFSRV